MGQKVTKFGIFSDPARKLSALTPGRRRILVRAPARQSDLVRANREKWRRRG